VACCEFSLHYQRIVDSGHFFPSGSRDAEQDVREGKLGEKAVKSLDGSGGPQPPRVGRNNYASRKPLLQIANPIFSQLRCP
jgi:hypothetical protein